MLLGDASGACSGVSVGSLRSPLGILPCKHNKTYAFHFEIEKFSITRLENNCRYRVGQGIKYIIERATYLICDFFDYCTVVALEVHAFAGNCGRARCISSKGEWHLADPNLVLVSAACLGTLTLRPSSLHDRS